MKQDNWILASGDVILNVASKLDVHLKDSYIQ